MSEHSELTYGQKACGVSFNPSNDPHVDTIKQKFADVIDYINLACELSNNPEVKRMLSIAITEAQTSQMWAVKAITWRHK
jgi:hypothetical protein